MRTAAVINRQAAAAPVLLAWQETHCAIPGTRHAVYSNARHTSFYKHCAAPPPSFTRAGIEAEDDFETYEKAQAKARGFDDWADGVPKGAGVTKRI